MAAPQDPVAKIRTWGFSLVPVKQVCALGKVLRSLT